MTLHVGLGTFRPVKVDEITDHHMHSEFYQVDEEAAEKINRAKDSGHRVICVGTTSCRTIESAADETGHLKPTSGWDRDFLSNPGYKFKIFRWIDHELPSAGIYTDYVSISTGRKRTRIGSI